jgi:hypothetical protein
MQAKDFGAMCSIVTRLAATLACTGALGCNDDIAPAFVIEGTGTLEGLVFFDADRNSAFDPSAGDTVVAGATLVVRERGTAQIFSGAADVTGTDGRFRIANLPLGTHDLFLDTTSVGPGVRFCQNPRPVTIALNLVRFAPVPGRDACLVAIAEAEALPENTFVTVQGLVTVAPGQHSTAGTNAYIEDASGGILLFGSALQGQGIAVGDRLEVSGNRTAIGTELEIANPLRVDQIVKNVAVPQPTDTTTGGVAAIGSTPTAPLQGRLVRVLGAQQTSAFAAGGGRNATFDDGSGSTVVRIEAGVILNSAEVATEFPNNGTCFDITGVVGSFSGAAQIKPRTLDDMDPVPCPP